MGALSQRTFAKVSGPAWEQIRGPFMQIARSLLAVSADASSDLFNTYVKFTVDGEPESHVFAAIWLKSSKRLVVGLALPENYEAVQLGPAPPKMVYKGLTKYFAVEQGGTVPQELIEWAALAYRNVFSAASRATAA